MELSMSIDDKDMVEEGRKKKKNVATNKDLW
jgi:hypothetical protein